VSSGAVQNSPRDLAAVIYAAKSTEDKHGSITTQIADCEALAARDGITVVGTYSDEAVSAYKRDRGPGLAAALEHAERDGCALVVQHSDRLARGDGKQARHLVEIALWALKADVTIRARTTRRSAICSTRSSPGNATTRTRRASRTPPGRA
jgi:DNA invertase Pin-like site-specific DNA recombinase